MIKQKFLPALLLCCSALWANYPEDVYFFELGPAVWEYFVSPDGGRVKIHRSLEITGSDFFLHMGVYASGGYTYFLKFSLDEAGNASLVSFNDERGGVEFPEAPVVFPSGGRMAEPLGLSLARGITIQKDAVRPEQLRSRRADILYRLRMGNYPIEVLLRYQSGIVLLRAGGKEFSKTTLRVFNAGQ